MTPAADIVVYTCVAGGYDDVRVPRTIEPGIDYVCFTDEPDAVSPPWRVEPLPWQSRDPALANRYVKMHPHVLFPLHACSVYVDANVEIIGGVRRVVQDAMSLGDIALYQHRHRNCSYAEAETCAAIGHDWFWRINAQMARYRRQGFPAQAGLFEASVIVRAHLQPGIKVLMDEWWREYLAGTRRDQISLPVAAWRRQIPIHSLGQSDPRITQRHFRLHLGHRRPQPLVLKFRRLIYLLFRRQRPQQDIVQRMTS